MGSVVKANIGDKEDNIREGRRRWTGKEVVGCVQAVVRNKKFLFQFENKNNKEMISCLLVYVCLKEEV